MTKLELLIHPTRLRIIQYLSIHKKATTNDIINSLGGVSKASIYNHIKLLEKNQILDVVQENRIRGTVEKVYALKKMEQSNDFNSIMTFLLSLMLDFQQYYEKKYSPTEDMLFAGRDYLLLTDEEFQQFFRDYTNLCNHYFGLNSAGAKLRNISIISAPINDKKGDYSNE